MCDVCMMCVCEMSMYVVYVVWSVCVMYIICVWYVDNVCV